MEGPGISYEPVKPPPMDKSEVIAILDDNLVKIKKMAAEYTELANEYRTQRKITENRHAAAAAAAFAAAETRLAEYNDSLLYIAIIKMAIKLILFKKASMLGEVEFRFYNERLATIINPLATYDSTKYANLSLQHETLESLTAKLVLVMDISNSYKQDMIRERQEKRKAIETQKAIEDEEQQSARAWVLSGKGGKTSRHRKSLRKHYTRKSKSNSNKSVAAAIKDISLAQARADFAALKAIPCDDINQAAKVGNAAMDHYFFRHRLAAKTKRAVSYYDWIKTDWKRNEAELRLYRFNLAQGKTPEKARYGVFRLYYGAIHGFKPLVAKWLYCTYRLRIAVLDFSAGWGGRCLGAMALGIPYIGIDTNKDLRPAYERMVKELDPTDSKSKVTMRFQDAAATDFSQFKYDMVFTSPPYFKTVRPIESYAHMPHYADRADFNARFLFPVVRNTYAHLARGGTYALNIPADMYDEIRAAGILPSRLLAKHRLFLQPRFAKGNPKHPDTQYEEHIYVWKK